MKIKTSSVKQTQDFAKKLAKKYISGAVIALSGPLGAGKTTFTQGFAKGLGISQRLLSPTFVLMRQYDIPGKSTGKLYHIDLYRLDNIKQIEELGLSEILSISENIILIEWAEKLDSLLPKNAVLLILKPLSKNSREITIQE